MDDFTNELEMIDLVEPLSNNVKTDLPSERIPLAKFFESSFMSISFSLFITVAGEIFGLSNLG